MKPSSAAVLLIALSTVCLPAAQAQSAADEPAALALRKIMQDMGKDMQRITAAISAEDWALVAKTAPLIADHPQPPLGEKVRILGFMGPDAGAFKRHDEQTHRAAKALEAAADRTDGQAVISAFAALQNACLSCHQSYRKRFVEHFYGRR